MEQEKNKELGICVRCKKNKASMTFAQSALDFAHGFTERICQECYDEMMKESNWFKEGKKEVVKDLKALLRNKGKSSILENDIKYIIEKYEN
jgi:superfamily II helicase